MRSNYKQLGQFISPIDIRNEQLEVETLLGVSVKKIFIPSIANTVGTDFKKYKIVKKHQFTYIPDTSRRGDKIGLAMLVDYDVALVSQAYTVFEIVDHNKLDPEYLMMWFRRPEFDRYARFKSHGSVREIFDWDEMCETELPVPSIEKQREIVKEYNTVVNRIKLNEQLNQKLEETAQALYKHWFVDFEFPNENGQAYKSSGGEMVYNEELDQEIPSDFGVCQLENFIDSNFGGDWGKVKPEGNYLEKVTCVRGTDIPMFKSGALNNAPIRYILNKNLKNKEVLENNIIIEISGGSPTQSTGRAVLVSASHIKAMETPIICSNFCRVIQLNSNTHSRLFYSHLDYLYDLDYLFTFENSTTGVKNFDLTAFLEEEYMVKPNNSLLIEYNKTFDLLQKNILSYRREINGLKKLKELVLTKMSRVESLETEQAI
jgi:type I restriction enzyme S subunit